MSRRALRFSSPAEMPAAMRALMERQQQPAEAAPAPARPRHVRYTSGEMNKTEAAYAQHLEALIAEGVVSWYGFEVVKVRLAHRCWLSVDFLVRFKDGRMELHEVKGRKGDRYHATEDGKLKVKWAAQKYPFWPVRIVWPRKGGGWDQEEIR